MSYTINKSKLNPATLQCVTDGDFSVYKYSATPCDDLYNYRSIITHCNRVVCFSPPKSISRATFLETHSSKDVIVEEYIEGTMVNVFWTGNEWKYASRSKINANCFFFDTNGYFSKMVCETFGECNLDLDKLNKKHCYSFVMQHPENRIVTKFDAIQLYLIAAYEIVETHEDEIEVHRIESVQTDPTWATTLVKFPATILNFDLETQPDALNMPYTQMGLVFKNTVTGARCKLRNPAYEYVRQLRGNQPKLMYRYLELRKLRKTKEYLKYFPEHGDKFLEFRNKIHTYTNALYKLYVGVYIRKEDNADKHNTNFKLSLRGLHQIYTTQKAKINLLRVIEYVNSLPEAVLMTVV